MSSNIEEIYKLPENVSEYRLHYPDLKAIQKVVSVTKPKIVFVGVSRNNIEFRILDNSHVFMTKVTFGNTGHEPDVFFEMDGELFSDLVRHLDKRADVKLSTLLTLTKDSVQKRMDRDRVPGLPKLTYTHETAPLDYKQFYEQVKVVAGMKANIQFLATGNGVQISSVKPNRDWNLGQFVGEEIESVNPPVKDGVEYKQFRVWFNADYVQKFLNCLKETNSCHIRLGQDRPLGLEIMNNGVWFEYMLAPIDIKEARERGAE